MIIPNIEEKLNQDCSLIHLIDEHSCLGNSYEVINYNVASLSSALMQMEAKAAAFNLAYNTFISYSGVWLAASSNVISYGQLWNEASSQVMSLSSMWNKEFSIFYPEILSLDRWYNYNTSKKTSISASVSASKAFADSYVYGKFPDWLSFNFPPASFAPGQKIILILHLYQHTPVEFVFQTNYQESCMASGGTTTNCGDCDPPFFQCNGKNGYDNCIPEVNAKTNQYNCRGEGAALLELTYRETTSDTNIGRIVRYKYIVNNTRTAWQYISN